MSGKPQFTTAQKDAITARGENLLVAAGAGSGKTTVLVERILTFLQLGGDVERILALTFTNAAAADMRQKIDRALAAAAAAQPDDPHLAQALALLPQAQISTIHSFCLDLLRRYGYRIALAPGFRVAGSLDCALLQQEVMDDLLEAEYGREDSLLPALADAYGGRQDDSALVALISALHKFSLSRPDPEAWLRNSAAAFSPRASLDEYSFATVLEEQIVFVLQQAARLLALAAAESDVPEAWLQLAEEEAQMLREAASLSSGLSERLRRLAALSFGRLASVRKQSEAEEITRAAFRSLRDQAKEKTKKLQAKLCSRSIAEARADLDALQPLLHALIELVLAYGQALQAAKQEKGLIDFNDMEHLALALLSDPEIAAEVRSGFDEILVDEYQDINEVQEAILNQLSCGDNVFAVGDVKQSIYRFRLAEPGLFLQKYGAYGLRQGGRRIDLNQNYRSSKAIVAGINFLFHQMMRQEVAELDYDDSAALRAGRAEVGSANEFWLIDLDDAAEEALPGMAAEARLIARRIEDLHAQGYAYQEMAVLVRARNRVPQIVIELSASGIPYVTECEEERGQSAEISLLLSLLQIIDNLRQDIPLAAVLRSPLFHFSADELAKIRLASTEPAFCDALASAAAGTDALAEKCRAFLQTIASWRAAAASQSVADIILRIYRESGIALFVGALPDGGQRERNLQQLLKRARQYDASSFAGLFRFLRFLEDSETFQTNTAALSAAAEDAVCITTIHKSKGLEYPVVFVAGLSSAFSIEDEKDDVVWERSLGLGARLADRRKRCKYPTLSHIAITGRLHALALAEEMRVCYVALTRARERLILTASLKKAATAAAGWAQGLATVAPLAVEKLASARAPLDWIAPALLRHPAAAALRTLANQPDLPQLAADSSWQVTVLAAADLADSTRENTAPAVWPKAEPALLEAVERTLAYRYPFADTCTYPVKWSVSALNRLAREDEEVSYTLPAAQERGDAALLGTAYHRLLELLDLANVSLAGVTEQKAAFAAAGLLLPEEEKRIEAEKISAFFQTELGRCLVAAEEIHREAGFTYQLPLNADDTILVQGVLDAVFRTDAGWVLLDYKTGGFGKSDAQLAAQYRTQLQYYQRAVEMLWQGSVAETWLVMLDLGRNISL